MLQLKGILVGLIVLVIGILITPVVTDGVSTVATPLGSYTGAGTLMNLVPLLWVVVIVAIAATIIFKTMKQSPGN